MKTTATIQQFFRQKPMLRAYLFGSQVRQEANENSNVDILVELDYKQKVGRELVSMQKELKLLLGAKVDLVSARGLSTISVPILMPKNGLFMMVSQKD